jgi:tetraacyldisaccharide 4'-kinase
MITDVRNLLYNTGIFKSEEFDLPVICIGNITVGGTGKTPHAEYIIDLLRKDFKVALLSRGYKRRSKGFRLVSRSSTVEDVGDEPLQVFLKFPEIIVAVDRDRSNGIRTILKEHPETEVVILDDGFQHRKVRPGFSILLTDFSRLISRDFMMPYGNLRENRNNRKRADVIVVTKTPDISSGADMERAAREVKWNERQKLFFTSLSYRDLIPMFKSALIEESGLHQQNHENNGAVLVTGIASPEPLKKFLEKYFKEIIHLDFPDHYFFRKKDVEKISKAVKDLRSEKKIVITTEKDAVRLREFINIDDSLKRSFYCIPVGVTILNEKKNEFDNMIIEYVRKNKRDNRVP